MEQDYLDKQEIAQNKAKFKNLMRIVDNDIKNIGSHRDMNN